MEMNRLLLQLSYWGDFKIYTQGKVMFLECRGYTYKGEWESYEETIFNGVLFLLARVQAEEMVKNAKVTVEAGK